jgi:transposase
LWLNRLAGRFKHEPRKKTYCVGKILPVYFNWNNPMPKKHKLVHFIGVDISKSKLDVTLMHESVTIFHRIVKNKPEDISRFLDEIQDIEKFKFYKALFMMENTGIYGSIIIAHLQRVKANFSVLNPLQLKRSLGVVRSKDDKIDSARLAEYAFKNKENFRPYSLKRPVIVQLAKVSAMRTRLTSLRKTLITPIKDRKLFLDEKSFEVIGQLYQGTLIALEKDLLSIDLQMIRLIQSDLALKRLYEIVTSVPYVGRVTAIQIILSTNEFKDINEPKKFGCYAGLAPFPQESGTSVYPRRVSHFANKKVKSLLHLCAIAAVQHVPDLKEYYLRKKAEGKAPMAVINAVRYKLVLRVFACVKADRLYTKTKPAGEGRSPYLQYDSSAKNMVTDCL